MVLLSFNLHHLYMYPMTITLTYGTLEEVTGWLSLEPHPRHTPSMVRQRYEQIVVKFNSKTRTRTVLVGAMSGFLLCLKVTGHAVYGKHILKHLKCNQKLNLAD